MNLFTRADGIFGTHVTWEDIENDMQRELHTVALFGPNKSAKNIGDGRVSFFYLTLKGPCLVIRLDVDAKTNVLIAFDAVFCMTASVMKNSES
ncbi:unnamed protein product [Strongylus vulgaris]|uniref:Uncharacterized protein n=1 Tax=Strongylus vulgaris TaxID=40348 RepID=A0A3P7L9K4_STRVU|nr:unnamed protein product [Strongylus vulgaris]